MKILKSLAFARRAHQGANILLTGVPRSGTTLACKLLCDLPNVVALNEPMGRQFFPTPKGAEEAIAEHFKQFRHSLYFQGTALARTRDGKIVDNAFAENSAKVRKRVIDRSEVTFAKPLFPDFTLLMKHCAEFTLILPALKNLYTTYAIIRNPLAVLASWNSVNVPVSRGKVAKSARLNPAFHASLNKLPADLLTRQLYILSWYFEQYQQLSDQQIIRYEQLTAAPALSLGQITGETKETSLPMLHNRNTNQLYNKIDLPQLLDRLLKSEGAYWAFYERQAIIELAEQMRTNHE